MPELKSTLMQGTGPVHHRDIVVSPPTGQVMPESLVGSGGLEADVREARIDGRLVGAYRIEQLHPTHFRLVAVHVMPPWRRRGVGTWLLRHAIGLAESRGARVIDAVAGDAEAFFRASGFVESGGKMRLRLTPE